MKSHAILGSIGGFFIGAGFSLADGCPWSIALWRACVAALIVAVLMRWWSRIWMQSLGDAIRQRRHASANPAPKPKPAVKP